MRIGVDIRPLQNNNRFRGIGRYLENVLREVALIAKDETFVCYAEKGSPLPNDVIKLFTKTELRKIPSSKVIKRIKYVRALARPQVRMSLRSGEVDIFFQADPWLGIPNNVPTVATLHDLIPMFFKLDKESKNLRGVKKYKQIFGEKVQDKFYKEMLHSYRFADSIVAISKSSKEDFLKYVNNSKEDRIFITPLAGSEESFPDITETMRKKVREKYGLGNSNFLLYVGGVDLRKNIAGLARDFFELKKKFPDLKMVMVGKEFGLKRDLRTVGWTAQLEKHEGEAKDILTPGFVPDDELAVLYAEAAVFPFPSLYEGFGLPILEAMHLGCPVVCYDNSSLPEVAGNAALVVPTGQSLASSIARLLTDDDLRQDLIRRGEKQARSFSWEKTAKETLKVLKETAKNN